MNYLTKAMLISLVLFIVGLFVTFMYAFINNVKLYFYLKKVNYTRWKELTTFWKLGPGASNPFRWLPYIYGHIDNSEEAILRYKDNVRLGLKSALFFFIAVLVSAAILVIMKGKSMGAP